MVDDLKRTPTIISIIQMDLRNLESPNRSAWSPLHDLALVYLSLVHGADASIDPSESVVMSQKLRSWYNGAAENRVNEVIHQVMLVYMGDASQQMLETSVASLRQWLPKDQRIAILNDLADIATADGMVVPGEIDYIQQLAAFWEVDGEID